MPFSIGAPVIVLTVGRKRGVVIDAGRGGHYRVQVENAVVSCREHELVSPPEDRKRRKGAQRERTATTATDEPAAPAASVDLHGLTVEAALARVITEIDRALLDGADRIEIVHGKGAGRIREALHRHLGTLSVVKSVKLDPRNPGVTWVYL